MKKLALLFFLLGASPVFGQCVPQFDPLLEKLICPKPSGAGSGTVTSITIAGTLNQITATGTCAITTAGTCTLSVPSVFLLPGTINKITLTPPTTAWTISPAADNQTTTIPGGTLLASGGALGTPSSGSMANLTGLTAAQIPTVAFPAAGTSATLAAPAEFYECSSTCTVTLPVPAAGLQFCVRNASTIATVVTLAALGSSARYEKTDPTLGYGTAGTGTAVSGGTAADKICFVGKDATHYDVFSFSGVWTMN